MTTDLFGVPESILGVHDEDFFGALGRIAALSALLEERSLRVYQTVTNSPQDAGSQLSASELVKAILKAIHATEDRESAKVLRKYCADIDVAIRTRNDYMHSLWPAQSGGRLYAWRMPRAKKGGGAEAVPVVSIHTDLDELKHFIERLVELIQRWGRVYPAACDQQSLKISCAVIE